MKFFKKCLIVVVSLFVILATQPTNVFAESYTVDTLQKDDFIAQGDIISFTSNFRIIDSTGPDETDNYTANKDYFVSEIYYDGYNNEWSVFLSQPVKVTIKHDDGGGTPTEVSGSPYLVPQDSKFSIDKSTNTLTLFGGISYQPENPNSYFVGWSWQSTSMEYTGTQIYKASHSNETLMNLCGDDYEITITSTLYQTQNPNSISVIVPSDIETDSDVTLFVHLLDDKGNDINDNTKQINVEQLNSDGSTKATLDPLVFNDGYSLTIHTPNEPGQIKYKFSYSTITFITTIHVEGENNDPIVKNNAWPWLVQTDSDGYYLQTGLVDEAAEATATWEWQISTDNGETDEYKAIEDSGPAQDYIDGVNSKILYDGWHLHGVWIRCEITYGTETVDTKGVQILDTSRIDIASDEDPFAYYFISNGKGAYAIGHTGAETASTTDDVYTGQFDILGLYNGRWVRTSYNESWGLYMKKPGGEITGTGHSDALNWPPYVVDSVNTENIVGLDNIKDIYPRFSSYESSNVIFDIRFNEACDAAIYTDVQIGDYDLSDYADEAAVKANINNNSLAGIQMFAHGDFATADETTCTFLIKPITKSVHFNAQNENYSLDNVSTFSIDAYMNGDSGPNTYVGLGGGEYNNDVFMGQKLFFNYNKGPWYDWGDDPFVYKNIGGQNIVIGLYDQDSVLSMSWANKTEISFRFGVGTAGSFGDEISFTEAGEEEHHHHSGGTWIEVPNTSASVR